MSGSAKMQLILELKNKLFNTKLMETQKKFTAASSKMRGGIDKLKNAHVKAFSAMRDQFPLLGRGMDLITNKYVLMAAAAAGIGMLLYSATNKAISFNHEFLQIKQLNLEKPKSQMEAYKNTIRDTAFSVGLDLNKTSQAFYDVQSATGLFGNEAKKVVQQVGKFSIATGADLNDSINATTKAMKAFGLGASDVTGLLESNAKTVQTGIVGFAQLAQVQTEYAGAAAGAGQSVDTANKLFAVFTSIAGGAAQGANMTKTAFQGLTQKSTIEGLKSIGVSMYDSNGQMRDLSNVVEEVATKFKGMNPKEIDELINKIGGPEGLRNMFTKLKTGSEDFFKTLQAYDASSFDLDKALKNARNDVTKLWNITKNQWGVVMENMGQKILPMVATALNWLNNIIVSGFTFYKQYSDVIHIIIGGLVAMKIATLASTIGFKAMFAAINTGIKSIPIIGWVIAGLTALVAAIVWVKNHVDGWAEQWSSITDFLKGKWDTFKLGLEVSWGIIAHGFQNMIDGIVLAWKWGMNLIGQLSNEQYAKDKANIKREQEQRVAAIKNNAIEMVKANKKANDALQWKLSLKKKENADEEALANEGLMPNDVGGLGGSSTGGGGSASEDVTKVVGAGQQVRNITVNIDALNKGGINTNNTTLASMNTEEIERWFNEAMLRTIRNLELSM
ncbi:MAG: phage tail tape measure protein [Bacteroidetes bacterium HGW-Bacteroidetes-12]|nr:MAG: phage tail tape measure protein [Bacteroidetes bacterium HGW-Bacteroidetes-12]